MSDSVKSDIETLRDESPSKPHSLSVYRFNKRSNKTTKLIDNADPEQFLKGRHQEYNFEFKEPTFVSRIVVHTADYSTYTKADFAWKTLRNEERIKERIRIRENAFAVQVNEFVSEFSFKPDKTYTGQPQITKVVVSGLTQSEFDAALSDVGRIDRLHAKIIAECDKRIAEVDQEEQKVDDLTAKQEALQGEIDKLNAEKNEAENDIGELQARYSELDSAISARQSEESELQNRISQINDNIDERKQVSQALHQEIIDRRNKLQQLKADINLFPTEIKGFVDQGADNISRYTLLAFLPIVILFYVTWYLFDNAADFAAAQGALSASEMIAIFVSRLPFVAVSVGIVSVCFQLARVFIDEVMRINAQRLNLSKISIIAKDVSDSSADGLDLEDRELYELRTRLKMDLLKSHLKEYIDTSYQYRPAPGDSVDEEQELEEPSQEHKADD